MALPYEGIWFSSDVRNLRVASDWPDYVPIVSGLPEFSLNFDGNDDTIINGPISLGSSGSVTISMWMKRADAQTSMGIMQLNNQFRLGIAGDGNLNFQLWRNNSGAQLQGILSVAAPPTGVWTHIMCRWATNQNSGFPEVFYNGSNQGFSSRQAQVSPMFNQVGSFMSIGSQGIFNHDFNGLIYQPAVFFDYKDITDVWVAGNHPKPEIDLVSNIRSTLDVDGGDVTSDPILGNWTTGGDLPVTSLDIPV